MTCSTSPRTQRCSRDASPHPSGRRPAGCRRGSAADMWGAAGAGCTPAIVSARTPIYPNGVRDPSSTSSGTGLGTSRAGPLTVPRGSPVRTVSPTGREATGGGPRKAAPSLDTALDSLEAELRPSSKGVGAEIARDRDRDRDRSPAHRRLSGSPTAHRLSPQPSMLLMRRSPSLSPPRDRGDRGPPSLEVRAARAAAAAAKLMTGGKAKGSSGSAAAREAEAGWEAGGEPSLYDQAGPLF